MTLFRIDLYGDMVRFTADRKGWFTGLRNVYGSFTERRKGFVNLRHNLYGFTPPI
jgi:hypothetical protein